MPDFEMIVLKALLALCKAVIEEDHSYIRGVIADLEKAIAEKAEPTGLGH